MDDKMQRLRGEITEAEARDRMVLEYTGLAAEYSSPETERDRRWEIRRRMREIREILRLPEPRKNDRM